VSATPLLRVGSRASALARTQAEWVVARLGCCSALVWIKSGGDKDEKTSLQGFDATGIFTAELQRALFEDRIDAAVHSLKDLPAADEPGIALACVPEREDPRDALVSRGGLPLARLPKAARVGTGSPRRTAQLLRVRPDLRIEPIRGNVDTRLRHVKEGKVDAVVLALAGLRRLGREGEASEILDPSVSLPAAGQGALGVTIRASDVRAESCLAALRDVRASAATTAERAALHALGAGCHAPVGALGTVESGRLRLRVRVCSLDGKECFDEEVEGALGEAGEVGRRAAEALLKRGAAPLVRAS
jgi:hydroxymethylbilane synthase